jgi:hypothetical protein
MTLRLVSLPRREYKLWASVTILFICGYCSFACAVCVSQESKTSPKVKRKQFTLFEQRSFPEHHLDIKVHFPWLPLVLEQNPFDAQ